MQIKITDHLGRAVLLAKPAQRVISIVPSQTELIYSLGVNVVGQTKFCIHPETEFKRLSTQAIIGGTKQLSLEKINALKPDLILANKEENTLEIVQELEKEFPVWVSEVANLSDNDKLIKDIGLLCGKNEESTALRNGINAEFEIFNTWKQGSELVNLAQPLRVLYLIWFNPWMAAGSGTFIDHMLSAAGMQNVLSDEIRYPALSIEQIRALDPELILLSSEPFPFKVKHEFILSKELTNSKIVQVNGVPFSWYGSSPLSAPSYFKSMYESLDLKAP